MRSRRSIRNGSLGKSKRDPAPFRFDRRCALARAQGERLHEQEHRHPVARHALDCHCSSRPAQPAKVYRVGVIFEGGSYSVAIDGLKDGLKDLGWTEGKNYVLETRDLKGDRKAAEAAARSIERDKGDLIYTVSTSVTTAVKRATGEVPIVFAIGDDPVAAGLVESFARPGGRMTGVHNASSDLTAKRLEVLKSILPEMRRVVTFYDPGNATAIAGAKSARAAGQRRVLTGTSPRDLPVESIDRVEFA